MASLFPLPASGQDDPVHVWAEKLEQLDLSVRLDIPPVPAGSVWRLGTRRVLAVVDPHDWEAWTPLMRPGWAVAYWADTSAGAVPISPKFRGVVALQPVPYLAAHIVETFRVVYPSERVVVVR